ncbi:CAP Gly-rich domain-containing protein [Blastocladiella britannica]|nr:CAP Gly-rich domain-containing protein [Blastocladiella britannica]
MSGPAYTVSLGGSPIVTVFVESDNTISSERRFDKSISVPQLRVKLEPITGVMSSSQKLMLLREAGGTKLQPLCEITGDDSVLLGSFPIENFMTIRVIDLNPSGNARNQYTDVSLVDKYEMEDDKYDTMRDTVRDFKRRNKLGRFDDAQSIVSTESLAEAEHQLAAAVAAIPVGSRCQVEIDAAGGADADAAAGSAAMFKKRGEVKFVGLADFKSGVWVGVEYDEPVGKHNGTVAGKSYFTARNKHGAFVRTNKVQVGDFPELDLFDELEEM